MDERDSKRAPPLNAPDLALTDYLDALLSEVAAIGSEEIEPGANEVRVVAFAPARPVVSADGGQSGGDPRHETLPPPAPPADESHSAACPRPVLPHWAGMPFQCLLVRMAGLKVAIPLLLLNSITEWRGKKATHLPGQPPWHLGLLEHRGTKVTLVDTALLVMPEKAGQTPLRERIQDASHVLIVGGGHWGLLCDRLLSPILLDPANVRWREARGNRPWMVGTLPEQLCILLDVDVLLETIGHE